MEKIRWQWVTLNDLAPEEQYRMHQARQRVFAVERGITYLDADDLDLGAYHLIGWDGDGVAAYLRVIPLDGQVQISRVLTDKHHRGKGLGRELMEVTAEKIYGQWGEVTIEMRAQAYLETFYTSLGYMVVGSPFILEGVRHIKMVKGGDRTGT